MASGPFFDRLLKSSRDLSGQMEDLGLTIVAPGGHASPAVITLAVRRTIQSEEAGARLEAAGYVLGYLSEYLLRRNWIQVCLTGEFGRDKRFGFLAVLAHLAPPLRAMPATHAS